MPINIQNGLLRWHYKLKNKRTKMTSQLIDKYCKVFLKNKFCYSGVIISDDDVAVVVKTYKGIVSINRDEISTIVEQVQQ